MATLASLDDVEARLGRPLTADEAERAPGLLVEASASARAWMRCDPDPVPDDVALVVSRMVSRMFLSPDTGGATNLDQFSMAAGPFSRSGTFTEGSTSGSPWLTKDDKRILRRFSCRGMARSFPTW